MSDRARHLSIVRLGVRPAVGASLAIIVCWLLFLIGVVLVPLGCFFWALITSGPIEYSGPRPPSSGGSVAVFWTARVVATASALGLLTTSIVVTVRGGRLITGWLLLTLGLPIIFLLWDVQLV